MSDDTIPLYPAARTKAARRTEILAIFPLTFFVFFPVVALITVENWIGAIGVILVWLMNFCLFGWKRIRNGVILATHALQQPSEICADIDRFLIGKVVSSGLMHLRPDFIAEHITPDFRIAGPAGSYMIGGRVSLALKSSTPDADGQFQYITEQLDLSEEEANALFLRISRGNCYNIHFFFAPGGSMVTDPGNRFSNHDLIGYAQDYHETIEAWLARPGSSKDTPPTPAATQTA